MKRLVMSSLLATLSLFSTMSLSAANPQPRRQLAMFCSNVGGNAAIPLLRIYYGQENVILGIPDQVDIPGQYEKGTFNFTRGEFRDSDYLSLEIKKINGRFVGMLLQPNPKGPAAYSEAYFACVEYIHGAASSNGG